MLVLLMTAVTGAWAETITVVWDSSTNSFDGRVQYSGDGPSYEEDEWALFEGGSFTTNLGNFTQIQISGGSVDNYGAPGWNGTTWTGNASSVYMNAYVTSNHGTNNFTITFTIEPIVNVTGITLSETAASMTVGGDALTLTATVAPAEATDKSVTWTSSDETVATVTDGVVTAVGAGTATITATATNGTADTGDDVSATCAVTVAEPTYTVTVKEGTDDAANWQGKAGEGEYQSLPLEGVAANTAVSVKYSGAKKVKSVKAKKKAAAPAGPTLDLATVTEATTVEDGYTLTGTLGANVMISIADGATVMLDGVTINGYNSNSCKWAGITCLGDATIILSGTNKVKGFYDEYPGIYVPQNKTVTIDGSGSLTASSKGYACGIGGGDNKSCGNIVIAGGTITATGGYNSAGIGGGNSGSCGDISITGGTVNAKGGEGGAGIGNGDGGSCGNISITGGTINATGGNQAAGIGGGYGGSCGTVTITNGVTSVTATKGKSAQHSIGVGSGNGTCGTVTIGGATGAKSESPYTYPEAN